MLLSAALLTAPACTFLDEEPESFTTVQNMYKTYEDFELAVDGAYSALSSSSYTIKIDNSLGNYRYGMLALGECGTDEMYAANDNRTNEIMLDTYSLTSADNTIGAHYGAMYQVISRANQIICRLDDGRELDDTWRPLLGHALFLRGLAYFNLVRTFGGVPLITEPLNLGNWQIGLTRNDIQTVYTQIDSDLERAAAMLPTEAPADRIGRATRLTVWALEARANLHAAGMKHTAEIAEEVKLGGLNSYDWVDAAARYAKACEACKLVFETFPAQLEDIPYGSTFWPNKNGAESIFEIQFSTDYGVNVGGMIGHAYGLLGTDNGRKWMRPTGNEYFRTLEEGDTRTEWNQVKAYWNNLGQYVMTNDSWNFGFMKYNHDYSDSANGGTPSKTPQNYPAMRLAEVWLIYAEAQAELAAMGDAHGSWDEALAALNTVRRRARNGSTTVLQDIPASYVTSAPDFSSNDQSVRNEIYRYLKPVAGVVTMSLNGSNVGTINVVPGELDTPIERFRIFLLNERKWELVGEGQRWFDLVRLNYLKRICDALDAQFDSEMNNPNDLKKIRNVKPFHVFRPIPLRETDLGVRQNHGYE